MPLHPDFARVKAGMTKKHGEEKGTSIFYAWLNSKGLDETKSMDSQRKKLMKELRICVNKLSFKEEGTEFYTEGFIATDHPDRAESESDGKKFAGDIVPKTTLQKIVDTINSHNSPASELASYRHDWIREQNPDLYPAGKAVSAELKPTGDGHFGAYVKVHHSKNHPQFEEIKYDVEHGYLPGYSIEYDTKKYESENIGGKEFRVLTDIDLAGFGLANARRIANPQALIKNYGWKELPTMETEFKMEHSEEHEGETSEEMKKKKKKMEEEHMKTGEKEATEEPPAKESKFEVSEADFKRLSVFKELEAKEAKMKEIKDAVETAVKERIEKSAPFLSSGKRSEMKELASYKESLKRSKELDAPLPIGTSYLARAALHQSMVNLQYKEAARLANSLAAQGIPLRWAQNGEITGQPYAIEQAGVYGERLEVKEIPRLEMKAGEGLQVDTNLAHASWTYGSYYQSPVELNDIYGPTMVNQLNDQTTTWGKLQKENWAGRALIQFRARSGRNSTAGGYSEGANLTYGTDFTGVIDREKFQQPYCYYRVLAAVTGQEMAFARAPGGMGDIWADEVRWSMVDLIKKLNQDVLSTGDGTSESAVLGFEGLILGTTGTLYGKNIATYTTLRSHKENMSSATISLAQMRKMIRYVQGGKGSAPVNSNARVADLVFFTAPLQVDKMKGIYQTMQRIAPTSARVGFEGTVEIDGVPIFADPDINTDDVFLIDLAHTKLAVNLGPVIEQLPVTADARAAHIKIYFNLYSDAPANNYWAHTFATAEP